MFEAKGYKTGEKLANESHHKFMEMRNSPGHW